MPRWTVHEQQCIDIMKERLKDQLAASPQYPEVVGERKMIRFLRGHGHDVDKVTTMMSNFLKWREDNKINEIRTDIVERGYDHPLRFPKGDVILSLIPQLVILPNAMDNTGSPICVEQYDFVPSEVFKYINITDYILFVTYSLEYRSLIVEQISEQRERAYLAALTQDQRAKLEEPDAAPYGVIVNTCVIRDLSKRFLHCGCIFFLLLCRGCLMCAALYLRVVVADGLALLPWRCYCYDVHRRSGIHSPECAGPGHHQGGDHGGLRQLPRYHSLAILCCASILLGCLVSCSY